MITKILLLMKRKSYFCILNSCFCLFCSMLETKHPSFLQAQCEHSKKE